MATEHFFLLFVAEFGGFRKFSYLLIVVRLCGIDFLLSSIINIFILVDVS